MSFSSEVSFSDSDDFSCSGLFIHWTPNVGTNKHDPLCFCLCCFGNHREIAKEEVAPLMIRICREVSNMFLN